MTYHLLDQGGHYITDAEKVQHFDFMLDDKFYGADEKTVTDELRKSGYEVRELVDKATAIK